MKRILQTVFLLAGLAASAECSFTDLLVSQRWPWSEKVDIDFTLSGGMADVDVYGVWDALRADGADEDGDPVLLGTFMSAKPGHNRFTWDPAASPWAGQTLTGFTVRLVSVSAHAHDYLVVDLQNGGVSYRAGPDGADGRWSDVCKTRKMVFRRVPSGVYTLGLSSAELARWYGTDKKATAYVVEQKKREARTQTFTSDFYLAVFQMTVAQYENVTLGAGGGNTLPKLLTYDELRGATNAADGICWPGTGHAVAADSFLARFRRRVPSGFIADLPTEEQWEAAARAGTPTVFPNGGSVGDDDETLWSTYALSSWYHGNGGTELKEVGLKAADNSLGFHDMLANRVEWTLDVWRVDNYGRASRPGSGTDPVGAATWNDASQSTVAGNIEKINKEYGKRVVRSAFPKQDSATLTDVLPSVRNGRYPQATDATARLCIHLKPLVSP